MRQEIENRLIDFSVKIIQLCELIPSSFTGKHLSNQIIRSSTSSALNYGEVQSAESNKDFIHKLSVVLKELRETLICIKIIQKVNLLKNTVILENVHLENNELISIFYRAIQTSLKKEKKGKR